MCNLVYTNSRHEITTHSAWSLPVDTQLVSPVTVCPCIVHYSKKPYPLRNCKIPKEDIVRDQEPRGRRLSGSWSPDGCLVGNYAISQHIWVLAFILWPMGMSHWVLVNCIITNGPFLHWSWNKTCHAMAQNFTPLWRGFSDTILAQVNLPSVHSFDIHCWYYNFIFQRTNVSWYHLYTRKVWIPQQVSIVEFVTKGERYKLWNVSMVRYERNKNKFKLSVRPYLILFRPVHTLQTFLYTATLQRASGGH